MTAVDAKAELAPNLLTSHHNLCISTPSSEVYSDLTPKIVMTAWWYYLRASECLSIQDYDMNGETSLQSSLSGI